MELPKQKPKCRFYPNRISFSILLATSLHAPSPTPLSLRRQISSQTSHAVTILFIPCRVSRCRKTVLATFRSTSSIASQAAVKSGQTKVAIGPEKITTLRQAWRVCLQGVCTLGSEREQSNRFRFRKTKQACLCASALFIIDCSLLSSVGFSRVTTV